MAKRGFDLTTVDNRGVLNGVRSIKANGFAHLQISVLKPRDCVRR